MNDEISVVLVCIRSALDRLGEGIEGVGREREGE